MSQGEAKGWTLAAYEDEAGDAFMVRARALPDEAERARFAIAVWVMWPWGAIASEAEEDAIIEEMVRFEDAVHGDDELWDIAMMVAVVTTGEGRRWLFYTADSAALLARVEAATDGEDWPELGTKAVTDPDWRAARDLVQMRRLH